MRVAGSQRAEQSDRADHQGCNAEPRRALALESGQIARAEQGEQADQADAEPE